MVDRTCERLMLLPEREYFAAWIISVLDPRRAESALHMLDRVANRFADNMVAERTERLREALADSLSSLDGACRALRVGYEAGIAQELRRLVEVADSLGVQVPEDGRFWLDMRAALEESDERAD